ncbi:uncharacterized protein LOC134487898 isoform X2 [Candoia aspera]|uniref:uncharacterized protein LOC134487898 isoform X2 n=1 Tax=Candoia aspera TaxID=51853 RepID=UPI002FD87095
MPSMYQISLFAICAFICLTPGATLQCRMCMIMHPGELCLPSIACQIVGKHQTCHLLSIYYNGELQQKILSCKLKSAARCGSSDEFPEKGIRYEYHCCENKDFCNESL